MAQWLERDLKRAEKLVIVLIGLAIAVRLSLPFLLRHEINRRLAHIGDYNGHVDDVGVHLLHGGYSMHNFVVRKNGAPRNEPLLAAEDVTFRVDYGRLLHGSLVGDLIVTEGSLNFKRSPNPVATQNLGMQQTAPNRPPTPAKPWQDTLQSLFPVRFTFIRLVDCRIHYVDDTEKPAIDVAVNHVQLEATGLANRRSDADNAEFPAAVAAEAETVGHGLMRLDLKLDPLAEPAHFQLFVIVQNLPLPAINAFLLAYAKVDVGKGYLQLYTQVDSANGSYQGYFKPIVTELNFHTPQDRKKPPLQLLWKDIVAAVTKLIRSGKPKQLATIVPFQGRFDQDSTVDVPAVIGNLFRNGFVAALRRGLEPNAAAK